MAYAQTSLAQFISQMRTLLDDPGGVYWTNQEITYALWEALRVFGAETNYWRTMGAFNITLAPTSPYYDLSVQFPVTRSRSYTLTQMVIEMQYMLLENPSGITGIGMSGQISINDILNAIVNARNRFVLDAHLPISVHTAFGTPTTPGVVTFSQSTTFVHRVSWQDTASTTWYNLPRADEWDIDKNNYLWTAEPAVPQVYSEAVLAPLQLQLAPPQSASGTLEALTVDSLLVNIANGSSTFGIPDEWIHAVKYAAMSQLLSGEGQAVDYTRAQYCENRYLQAISFAKDARSVVRVTCDGLPVSLDSLFNADMGYSTWRNQVGAPSVIGSLYDIIVPIPAIPDRVHTLNVNMVQTAPLPTTGGAFIQMGQEDIDNLKNYVVHALSFKCGGKDFTATYSDYDTYMKNVAGRKGVNAAKIMYLVPLLGQPQVEWAQRPDRMEKQNA